jgi:hypothetical protein
MQRFVKKIIPFVLAGVVIVILAFGLILSAYLFLFGACIGLALFVIAWLREKFFPSKVPAKTHRPNSGRIIDSDEWHKS